MPRFYCFQCLGLVKCFIFLNVFWPPPPKMQTCTIFLCVILLWKNISGRLFPWKILLCNLFPVDVKNMFTSKLTPLLSSISLSISSLFPPHIALFVCFCLYTIFLFLLTQAKYSCYLNSSCNLVNFPN